VLSLALTGALMAGAQQNDGPANAAASGEHRQVPSAQAQIPSVEQQMKVFTEKLDLTADQQAKLRPIVRHLHDVMMKAVQNPNLSHEERVAMVRPAHMKAHEEFQQILSEEQKEKLEAYMHGPHPEMQMKLGGSEYSTQPQQ
jgi:predicted DNA-binding protein YlxM (UPF0122 family)